MTIDQPRQYSRWSLRHGQDLPMSTVQERRTPPHSDSAKLNPFPYGWRDVRVEKPDGRIAFEQVALTLEDALHPEEGDYTVSSHAHELDCNYLQYVFGARLSSDTTAVVLADVEIFWDDPAVKQHRPDIAVIPGVQRQKNWPSFHVVEEGTRPVLIVEVVSPSTRVNDVETKVEEYARVKVAHYVIADVWESDGRRHVGLIDYRLGPGGDYERQPLDLRGRVWLDEVGGLWLGVVDNPELDGDRLALFDPATDEEIGDYNHLSHLLASQAVALAEAEARDREKAVALAGSEARIRELEAELSRLRANHSQGK
ncbi:MAG TPA: Uma2 family endonuclease [Isosphaeraceae bacterium]|nr:Uma2 family endonuclease [Isosphaeraceae bacterium]